KRVKVISPCTCPSACIHKRGGSPVIQRGTSGIPADLFDTPLPFGHLPLLRGEIWRIAPCSPPC
ncbi:hypothetical protein L6267_02710, partial [Candidatus Parcubacteria bacterium]|nr:hypothetical protein [Candidatus Parcubacteria bacterium]